MFNVKISLMRQLCSHVQCKLIYLHQSDSITSKRILPAWTHTVYCGQAGVGAVTGRPEVDGKHTDMFKLFTVSLMFPVGTETVLVANYSSLKV